jgi:xanthine dehydrogenase FAD-binding subunit
MFDFESYHKAQSVEEAVDLLQQDPKRRLLAGGTDILVRLREGHKEYRNLVDIHHLDELQHIVKESDGSITIGAGASFRRVNESPVVLENIPVLAEGAASVGGPQVRNAATIGGNICNGAACADSAAPLLVLNAQVELQGPKGSRLLPLGEFFLGPGRVNLQPSEILTAFRIAPADYQGFTSHFSKYAMRKAMDIATIGCAASCTLDLGKISELRLAYTVAGPTPLRCLQTEQRLVGMPVDEEMINQLKRYILEDLTPRDSWRASKAFREHIIITLTERVVRKIVNLEGV